MRGDGAGRVRIVGDHDDVRAGGVQLGHLVQLLRRDADRIEDVADAVRGEIFRLGEGGDGDAARLARQRQARHVDRLGGLHVRPQRHAMARRRRPPSRAMLRSRIGRSSTRQGVGRSASFMRAVSRSAVVVDRQHRARHVPPGKARQDRAGQAGRIDLDDLLMAEELVEATAEMAARLHHHDARRGDVEAERLEEHRIGALVAVGQHHHGDAVKLQRRRGAKIQRVVGVDAAPAAHTAGEQAAHRRRGRRRGGRIRPRRRG